MGKRDTDPPREVVEKFSIRWYLQELQELFVIAADAKRNGEPEFDQIARLLQELSGNFLQPAQIQQHHADRVIDTYRVKVAGLQPGTEEFFSTVEIGRWLRVCQDALAKDQSPEEISILIIPLVEQKLTEFGLLQPASPIIPPPAPIPVIRPRLTIQPRVRPTEPAPQVELPTPPARPPEPIPPTPKPVLRPLPEPAAPVATVPTKAPSKRSGIHPGVVAAGVALAGGLYGGYKLAEHLEQSAVAAADGELLSHQYDQIPLYLRDHLVGIPKAASEAVPHPQAGEVHAWGERKVWIEPDGSQLYIPTDTEYNKAFILTATARGNIDWRGARFPVQAIRELELSLAPSGLWLDPQGGQYAVLDGGHLLSVSADANNTWFLPFNEPPDAAAWRPLAELATYYHLPIDLSQIDTNIPAGFVDVEAQPSLQTIQCDLSYSNYNNTAAGVPIYPLDYKCQIPERSVADLAAVEAELSAQGYHLTIGDAKRPLVVQAYLREVLGKWASKPSPSAPHVAGLALDVSLLDATYIPVFESGYKPLPHDEIGSKSLQSPADQQQALAQGWSADEYRLWRTMVNAFEAHGYQFIKSERWHVEYTQ